MRYAMMIDLTTCVGCKACVSACKEQWDSGPGAARDWVHTFEHGTRGDDLSVTFYPGLCMQCDEHPCTTDCPTGATYMNGNGVVVVDPDVCIGCGNCVSNCPYGARHYDPEKRIIEKCNLCEPFVARGESPACVATCLAECRHFGDLDDPGSEIVRLIREKGAQPLVTAAVDVKPKVTFAGDRERQRILASDVIQAPRRSRLTVVWSGVSLPFARYVVPAVALSAIGGGALANLVARKQRVQREERTSAVAPRPERIPRHRAGMRFLHWFNLASWGLLLVTGTALMSAKSFALFGQAFPRVLAGLFGGVPALLRFHVLWGLLWAVVVVSLFFLYKRGGREALEEVRLRRDDLRWLMVKPRKLLGLSEQPLPVQDKYNAGQKVFALTAVAGTATIIATGSMMAFHLGSPRVVAAAILAHKLAIALALLGLSVHLTMAAVVREERPALGAMLVGSVAREHAERSHARWVEEMDRSGDASQSDDGRKP